MLPSKIKPLKARRSSKGKGKGKASSNKFSGASATTRPHSTIVEDDPAPGLSHVLPLATRDSASSSSFDSIRPSASFSKKVGLLRFISLHLSLIIRLSHLQGMKRNPVYLFYEPVDLAADGSPGKPGDKHYRCLHGSKKVFTVTKAMNHNLNGSSLRCPFILVFHDVFFYRSYGPFANSFQVAAQLIYGPQRTRYAAKCR